ncbi:hypothetical protein MLD38_038708 [Melastoma candidum]|uniref:Uncharacterized protein n=1 Tax=Melastoma candidum TaxID=119954 RepID=A0ACB9L003_9MYRT|nr:hypothetical protein MLD38_038708 [Melastoma candidum]
MLGFECFCWRRVVTEYDSPVDEPQPFSLPSPLPVWPQGKDFSTGRINLGKIEVVKITKFERVWSYNLYRGKTKGVSFYRPNGIPEGFHCLGYYCQPNEKLLRGYVLAARNTPMDHRDCEVSAKSFPPLNRPLDFSLVGEIYSDQDGFGFFWLPNAPEGYRTVGMVVTNNPEQPNVSEVMCVREDLTTDCEASDMVLNVKTKTYPYQFSVWNTRPCKRGIFGNGVSVGTFFFGEVFSLDEDVEMACLKNVDPTLHAMPNLEQLHSVISHYGPTVFFHPDEVYLPSSVNWFFKNGAILYLDGDSRGEPIDFYGSNLPGGGCNDGEFWIDLPDDDDASDHLKKGNLESAELYVHVKPTLGGTFTDIAMWVFCPFNGPATLKIGMMSFAMTRLGQHVGDWEHYTLRVCNFTGELWSVYFSEHSGGEWVDASELEFLEGNKCVVYSSRNGHSSYPHAGTYIQGSSKLGIGARNDTAKSKFSVDSSRKYRIISAEYLGDEVVPEPAWLQYMREWGPTIVYDSRSEIERIINRLPLFVRFSVENLIDLFPTELYGEEGPTGPKEKDNWNGDERS